MAGTLPSVGGVSFLDQKLRPLRISYITSENMKLRSLRTVIPLLPGNSLPAFSSGCCCRFKVSFSLALNVDESFLLTCTQSIRGSVPLPQQNLFLVVFDSSGLNRSPLRESSAL